MVHAQDVPPGLIARFDVTQRLEFSDNPDLNANSESEFFGRTLLGFNLESVTNVERFVLNLGTEIEEFQDDNDSSFEVTNSNVNLRYNRDTRNASIGADLRYRESDTSSNIFDGDFDQDGNIISQGSGTRVSSGYNLSGAIGKQAPIGASFEFSQNEIEYKGTTDPDLNDSTQATLSGQINFRVDSRISTSLTGQYSDLDTDDPTGTDRETSSFGLSTELDVTPILTATAGLSYDRIERTGGVTRVDEGISANVGLTREMTNGSIGFSYASDVFANGDGRRSFLSVDRSMELPRGSLSISLGLTGSDAVGTDPLIEANYRHDLPTGQLSFGLSQRVIVDNDNEETINTNLQASFNQRVTEISSYGIDVSFLDRNALGNSGNDARRINVDLTYRHSLAQDWGLVSGISHTVSTENNEDDRSRTTIFVGLQKSFNWNP